MKRIGRAIGAIVVMAGAPAAAWAGSYWGFAADGKTLSMTDLQSPRLQGNLAHTFEIVVLRAPTKVLRRTADYEVIAIDFRCDKGQMQRQYLAAYDAGGNFKASDIKPPAWRKTPPNGMEAQLQALGCHAQKPTTGFPIGDKRVSVVMAMYRAGRWAPN